jgi:hypothetical protein
MSCGPSEGQTPYICISPIESGRLKLSDKLAAQIKEVYGEGATVVPKVEKAVEAEVKKATKTIRATKKKVEEKAESVADAAAVAVHETGKKVEKKNIKATPHRK